MEVRKIMTKNPACCTPDSTLQEVAHMMEMYDCGCIPVVEDHKTNKPIGTITDRDIAIRAFAENSSPLAMKASDIMTTDIATVTPTTTIEQCRDEMENRQIRRILVTDKSGRCVGIVAQADLVEHETNPRQTAEFIRDISEPAHSEYRGERRRSFERENYQNFSDQNRSYGQDFPVREFRQDFPDREDRRFVSFSKPGKKHKNFRRKEKSFFDSGLLMPLMIGVGVGAAIKYFMPAEEKSVKTYVARDRVTSSVHTTEETSPKVSVKLPTETNIPTVESKDTAAPVKIIGAIPETDPDTDKERTDKEVGRSARL